MISFVQKFLCTHFHLLDLYVHFTYSVQMLYNVKLVKFCPGLCPKIRKMFNGAFDFYNETSKETEVEVC